MAAPFFALPGLKDSWLMFVGIDLRYPRSSAAKLYFTSIRKMMFTCLRSSNWLTVLVSLFWPLYWA